MRRWPVPRSDEILVIPVGGIGRIGMNWTLYGHLGRWILVDAGVVFPEEKGTDVEAIVPDMTSLAPLRGILDGLLITHAHQDHIGAIEKVWGQGPMNCPIFATPFAAGHIKRSLAEGGMDKQADVRTFPVGGSFQVGTFRVESIAMTHSTPEPVAFAIKTAAGTILHTGDWKFDPEPLIGQPTDFAALRKLGDEGVMAMLCDSTNADRDLPITSEAQVRQAFRHVFSTRRGAVAVCCFGSNVARMASAAQAAAATGRKIAVAGRSMRNSEEIARTLGLIPEDAHFLADQKHLEGLDRREMAVVCTGAQGEERAALAKLSKGMGLPRLGYGDTAIISARVIPGNEEAVEVIVNALRERGVEVLDGGMKAGGYPLHVSGHPGRSELRRLYSLVRPQAVIPVHGTRALLEEHAALAVECGSAPTIPACEGAVFSVNRERIRPLGRVDIGIVEICAKWKARIPARREEAVIRETIRAIA